MSDSFSEFLVSFSKSDNNFLKVPIVDNQLFWLGGANADEINFDANFFNTGNAQVGNENLKKITWEKITKNRFLKSKNDINNLYNCNLDDNKYEKLRMGWLRANKKYSRGSKNSETIHNFIDKKSEGVKKVQNTIGKG